MIFSWLIAVLTIIDKISALKCKICGRRAKWVVIDKKTGKKYYFCTKKCCKEYYKRNNISEE